MLMNLALEARLLWWQV